MPTRNKTVFARIASSRLTLQKWKAIISHLGVKAARQQRKIAKCFAKTAIGEKQDGNINSLF
jgi:hypothetical protein